MPSTKKPRKRYRPKGVVANTIGLATAGAARLRPEAVQEAIALAEAGLAGLQGDQGTEDHWSALAGAVELGLAIEEQGVVRGLQEHLKAAELALATIKLRATVGGGTWAIQGATEHDALDTFTWLHRRQLENLSAREWEEAHARAMRRVLGDGGRAIAAQDLKV